MAQREVVSKILDAYHTTRMSEVRAEDHILSKPYVRAAFAALRSLSIPEQTHDPD